MFVYDKIKRKEDNMRYDHIMPVKDYFSFMQVDKSEHTVRSYISAVERFFDYLNVKSLENIKEITSSDCREYIKNLKESGLENSSINAHIRDLKAIFNWMRREDCLEKSPFDNIKLLKLGEREPIFLSEEESSKLIYSCKRLEDKTIIALLLTTGMRREEIVNLTLSGYNGTHITFIGKGNKQRTLPLMPEVIELLNKYIKIRNKKYGNTYKCLFVSKSCKNYNRDGRFSGEAIRAKVKHACKLAGFPEERINELSTHKLRHTFTSTLMDSTDDIRIAQEALGHSDVKTTMRYAHMKNKKFDNVILNQPNLF
jgi:integrase/recombinase XerD